MKLLEAIINEISNNKPFFSFNKKLNQHTYKKFSELCIFYRLISKIALLENWNATIALQEYLLQELSNLSGDDVFKNFYTSYHFILPYVSVRQYGKSETLEACLHIINNNKFFSSEIPPHRHMEWDYMQYLQGVQTTVAIPVDSILTQDCHLQYFDRDLTYAFTHTLFYATDFGFMGSPPPVADIRKLRFQLECLIVRFYEEKDIDLVLELAINYFALLPYTIINVGVLEIVDKCLMNSSFIEFGCSEATLEKKYHSLFVLGIFYALLQTLLSNTLIPAAIRSELSQFMAHAVFVHIADDHKSNEPTGELANAQAEILAWQIIKQLRTKQLDNTLYQEYKKKYGNNVYLANEVIAYLEILKIRNTNNILWNKEFEFLNIATGRREALTKEFDSQVQRDIEYYRA